MTEATIAGPTAPKLELHRPVKSWVQVTATCNLQCKQCYGDCTPEPKSDEMTVDQFHRVLDDMADSGVIELLVEGGEPLQRPDVLAVLAHAAPKMLVRLRTNGTLLDEAMAERIRAAGIRNLCIDFMGATPETHDWHVGEPGAFEKTLNGLKVSLAAGFETLALMIMTKRNAGEIQRFIDLCAAAGVKRVGILRLYPLGRAKRHWKAMALSLPEQMAALEDLAVPDDVHLMRSWHPRDANCCWQASGVDARGQSVGCSYLRDFADFGNVLETPFLETWKHPLFVKLRSRDIEDHCPDCASTQGSAGGCRSTAYAFTGDWDAPDPYCTTTNRGIDVQLLPTRLLSEGA